MKTLNVIFYSVLTLTCISLLGVAETKGASDDSSLLVDEVVKSFAKKHVPDAQMIELFTKHKKVFDELVVMAKADADLFSITASRKEATSNTPLSKERVEKYSELLSEIGVDTFRIARPSTGYWNREEYILTLTSRGAIGAGDLKGYVYTSKTPDVVVPSLDNYKKGKKSVGAAYKSLVGNWYLFFSY
jgi:hypothetical protein